MTPANAPDGREPAALSRRGHADGAPSPFLRVRVSWGVVIQLDVADMPRPVPHPRNAPREVAPDVVFPCAPLREDGDDGEDRDRVARYADAVPELRALRRFRFAARGGRFEIRFAFFRNGKIRAVRNCARVDRLHADLIGREIARGSRSARRIESASVRRRRRFRKTDQTIDLLFAVIVDLDEIGEGLVAGALTHGRLRPYANETARGRVERAHVDRGEKNGSVGNGHRESSDKAGLVDALDPTGLIEPEVGVSHGHDHRQCYRRWNMLGAQGVRHRVRMQSLMKTVGAGIRFPSSLRTKTDAT